MKNYKFLFSCILLIIAAGSINSQQINFSSLNGPYGGNLGDVVFSSQGAIFVSSYYSSGKGIYKSIDNGINWELLPPVYPENEIFALGINKQNILFAGSGYYAGLFRSTDLGSSWIRLTGYSRPECWAIAFNDSNHIFAGDGDWGGLMRSTNNGDNWIQLLPNNVGVLSITIDSVGIIYVGARDNFYKSTDNGINWYSFYSGLPPVEIPTILCNNQKEIFVGTGYNFNGDGVYYSSNGGKDWIQRGLSGQTVYSLTMDKDQTLFAGTKYNGVYKSSDNGLTWEKINNGIYSKDIFRVKYISDNLLFACSESNGGIYRSSNLGESWEITGVPAGTINRAFINNTGEVFAATIFGVQKYNCQLNNWSVLGLTSVSSNQGWNWLSDIVIDNEDYMFVSSWSGSVYKSTNSGISWDSTTYIDTMQTHITDMAIYSDNSLLLGTFNYVKRSTDKGITWSIISNGLTDPLISNLEVTNEGIIYAVSGNNLCRASHIDSIFVVIRDNIFASSPPIYNRIVSGNNGLVFFADRDTHQGLYRSTDYGTNWLKVLDAAVYSISLYNNKYVVVGLSEGEGILFSSNLGNTWKLFKEGIPANAIITWSIINSDGYIYASADGLGLYTSNQTVTGVEDLILNLNTSFKLEQNYPNPFNPNTTISYKIKERGLVQLKVYDVLGKEVADLVNEEKSQGIYSVNFLGNNLASGVYICTLRVNDYTENIKMILLR